GTYQDDPEEDPYVNEANLYGEVELYHAYDPGIYRIESISWHEQGVWKERQLDVEFTVDYDGKGVVLTVDGNKVNYLELTLPAPSFTTQFVENGEVLAY